MGRGGREGVTVRGEVEIICDFLCLILLVNLVLDAWVDFVFGVFLFYFYFSLVLVGFYW